MLLSILSGPSCSKLTTSLVNISLKLWSTAYMLIFLLKKMWVAFAFAKATHIFFSKNTCELDIVLSRTVNILITNELIMLTTLWTTGPVCWFHLNIRKCTIGNVHPAKIQISMGICTVWSESSLCIFSSEGCKVSSYGQWNHLIRLFESAGWFESLLAAHVRSCFLKLRLKDWWMLYLY